MQFAVSSYLFPVICAIQQILLLDRRGLERDRHFTGRWRTDVGSIDGFEDLGRIAERLVWMACMAALSTTVALRAHARKVSPNMGRPLLEVSREASS